MLDKQDREIELETERVAGKTMKGGFSHLDNRYAEHA
jgi:hypothetical protein